MKALIYLLSVIPEIIIFLVIKKIFKISRFGVKGMIPIFLGCCATGWAVVFVTLNFFIPLDISENNDNKDVQASITCETKSENDNHNNSNSKETNKETEDKNENSAEVNRVNTNEENNNQNSTKNNSEISYNSYRNARYGYIIEYPSYLCNRKQSDNGDGVTLSDSQGKTKLSVWGRNNVHVVNIDKEYNEKIKSLQNDLAKYKITYNAMFDNSYAISWEDSSVEYYEYFRLGKGSGNVFCISYPKSEEAKYDSIIEHLYKSFKSTDLENCH